ncbi:MAG: CoA pyrophosphatase [Chloroflexi bacterium]|nr:CoA pyrophosphatase [Chloroflexota bacterium]
MTTPSYPTIEQVRTRLTAHAPQLLPGDGLMAAAVLIPLLELHNGLHILFTVRTSRVEHHKGEVSFPGGARDAEDPTLEVTAIRETHEEVGIPPDRIEVFGRMGDHVTRSGFLVAPYVGRVTHRGEYAPSGAEVAEVLEVPIASLWDEYLGGPVPVSFGGRVTTELAHEYHHAGNRIWGATARMLTDFLALFDQGKDASEAQRA